MFTFLTRMGRLFVVAIVMGATASILGFGILNYSPVAERDGRRLPRQLEQQQRDPGVDVRLVVWHISRQRVHHRESPSTDGKLLDNRFLKGTENQRGVALATPLFVICARGARPGLEPQFAG